MNRSRFRPERKLAAIAALTVPTASASLSFRALVRNGRDLAQNEDRGSPSFRSEVRAETGKRRLGRAADSRWGQSPGAFLRLQFSRDFIRSRHCEEAAIRHSAVPALTVRIDRSSLLPEESLRAEKLIRDVPDFPKPGILFKDITPVLAHPAAMKEVLARMATYAERRSPDLIVGIESRGFVFGMPLALQLGLGFAPVRKLGKLPAKTIREEYALEYGTNTMEMHADSVQPGQRVLIVDDLLATGGTARAAARLVEQLRGEVCGFVFLVELGFLDGRAAL